jgi:hypothetical protein
MWRIETGVLAIYATDEVAPGQEDRRVYPGRGTYGATRASRNGTTAVRVSAEA